MSCIDWPCWMNTIKETALSASHLGGENGGIKRGRKTKEQVGGMDGLTGKRVFFGSSVVALVKLALAS